MAGCYDQDFRFGSYNLKSAFFIVKFLEDVGYQGPGTSTRTPTAPKITRRREDFARGCMRTYLILKEKAKLWSQNKQIQQILGRFNFWAPFPEMKGYSKAHATKLLQHNFDRNALARKPLPYERLDQLTVDLLLGVL